MFLSDPLTTEWNLTGTQLIAEFPLLDYARLYIYSHVHMGSCPVVCVALECHVQVVLTILVLQVLP